MAPTRWYQERKREGYYRQAKREGYRARSAYKLQQIDERFQLLKPGDAVADLGCAPGGWTQVLVERVGTTGVVIGVDLQRTRPVTGARFIQGDFTRRETRARLAELLAETGRSQLDAVVSDLAPDMSGSYDMDQARSIHLAGLALEFALAHLRPSGSFACKVFEGADFLEFREQVRARFRNVSQFRPAATRGKSSEVYLVAKGFRPAVGKRDDATTPSSEAKDADAETGSA